jgi:phosphatidylinositol kinase/protein kinase (PI-3  family)
MTRDMVDGMGTSGTKGVFQRCAEETLRVLREDSEVIMTVLEVFKHDPLHSWYASVADYFLSKPSDMFLGLRATSRSNGRKRVFPSTPQTALADLGMGLELI